MSELRGACIIGQSGGPTSVINASAQGAIQAALNGFNRELLSNHIRTCVMDDIRNGNDEIVDELVQTLQKLMK